MWRKLIFGGISVALALLLGACVEAQIVPAGPAGPAGPPGPPGPSGPPGPPGADFQEPEKLSAEVPVMFGEGLAMTITGVEFTDENRPVVALTLTDADGRPLPPDVLEGYGFTIAQLMADEETKFSRYQNLLVREVQGRSYTVGGESKQPVLATATQAFAEEGGDWAATDYGYTYTFTNTLTATADPLLTTVVGVYAYKDGRKSVANDVFTFVPSGGEPELTREVVTTEACNTCHNPLTFHNGTRRKVGLCVTCHTDQTVDPESGNVVDFRVLIHKIHRSKFLPSAQSGQPYQIVDFQQPELDYYAIAWPQDMRNCTTCHTGGRDSENYKTKPQVAVCTACHDNVDPESGENHAGGVQYDGTCDVCHVSDEGEFDPSITGAHTLPTYSNQLRRVNFEIVNIENAVPGSSPLVTFKVTDKYGQVIALRDMEYLAVTIAGPTSDYVNRVTETIYRTAVEAPPTVEEISSEPYQYTFAYTLPNDAVGTYAVSLEGYMIENIDGLEEPVQVSGFNPVAYVSLDENRIVPRRQVVDRNLCNACHKDLALHGGIRQNIEYCVMCHNPGATDEAVRPPEAMPPASLDFKVLIHKIHRGQDRYQKPYIVYGFQGAVNDYTALRFPGNLADCQTCHRSGSHQRLSYELPLPADVLPTTVTQGGEVVSTDLPIRSVCTSCHERPSVAGHAELQTTASGIETCDVCHGPDKEFDVAAVHP